MPARSPAKGAGAPASLSMLASGYTDSPDAPGILLCEVDARTGRAKKVADVPGVANPSYCQLAGRRVYAASETSSHGGLASIRLGEEGTPPVVDGVVDFGGASGTCFVLADGLGGAHARGSRIYGADYDSGSVCVNELAEGGKVGRSVSLVQHAGFSAPYDAADPNADRQLSAHVHTLGFVPGTRLLAAVDLGLDMVVLYETDSDGRVVGSMDAAFVNECPDRLKEGMGGCAGYETETTEADGAFCVTRTLFDGSGRAFAKLPMRPAAVVDVPLHLGPRIVAYHPTRPLAALVCELGCKLLLYRVGGGGLRWDLLEAHDLLQGMPNIGSDGKPPLSAHCEFSKDGRFLYASTRGTDQLAVFEVGAGGGLAPVQTVFCEGDTPRHFALSPDGALVAVANQLSDNVSVFARDEATGRLKTLESVPCAMHPSCIVWL